MITEIVLTQPHYPARFTRRYMDAQEFTDIAEKHSGFVYNVACRMMGNPHDAEEVAQDAIDFVAMLSQLRGYIASR